MKNIVRVYHVDIKNNREVAITDNEEIVKILSKLTCEIDLDYDIGKNVKMGTSKELIGETVRVGEFEIQVPKH
jgi:hypothetical protein